MSQLRLKKPKTFKLLYEGINYLLFSELIYQFSEPTIGLVLRIWDAGTDQYSVLTVQSVVGWISLPYLLYFRNGSTYLYMKTDR